MLRCQIFLECTRTGRSLSRRFPELRLRTKPDNSFICEGNGSREKYEEPTKLSSNLADRPLGVYSFLRVSSCRLRPVSLAHYPLSAKN